MNVNPTTHPSTVRTIILSTAALALALSASAGLSISALWVAPLIAVAASFTKLVIDQSLPDHQVVASVATPMSTGATQTDIFI
ncbi:MAG: hypothetical protein HKN03_16795 [Acidimicrobiales bacterium]|nr:hypothetical protein [Acidimicrobiales bacterium]